MLKNVVLLNICVETVSWFFDKQKVQKSSVDFKYNCCDLKLLNSSVHRGMVRVVW